MNLFAFSVFCLTAISLTAADPALAPANPSSVGMSVERLEKIGVSLRAEIDKGAIPGAVVAIARKGKLVQ